MEIDTACSKKRRLIYTLVDDTPADITGEQPESCSSDGPQLVQVVVTS